MMNGKTPSTASDSRATAERIITGFYARLDKPAPLFLWFEDTVSCALALSLVEALSFSDEWRTHWRSGFKPVAFKRPIGGAISAGLWSVLEDRLASETEPQLTNNPPSRDFLNRFWVSFWDQVGNLVGGDLRDRLLIGLPSYDMLRRKPFAASQQGFWGGSVEGSRRRRTKTGKAGERLIELQHACGWWAPRERAVICSDRPRRIFVDIDDRLHNQRGAAVEFSEHHHVYAWHGTPVPPAWIEEPHALHPSSILTRPDAEQRMAGADIVGWARIIEGLPTRVIHADDDPGIGTLLECDLPGSVASRFLRVRCGTGRQFVLSVPRHVQTARQANAWTYGLTSNEYELEARS